MHLNSLRYKTVAVFTFRVRNPLHIGTGEFGAVKRILRIGDGVLIPSSTWKGAIRNVAEKLARGMIAQLGGLERLALACYREESGEIRYELDRGHLERLFGHERAALIEEEYRRAREEFKRILREQLEIYFRGDGLDGIGNELRTLLDIGYRPEDLTDHRRFQLDEAFAEYLAYHCPIGRLFGNRVLSGKVRPQDTLLMPERIELKPGVGIDRRSGKVSEGHLRFLETIPPGTEVKLTLVADNLFPGDADSRLMAGVLEWIKDLGLQIGAGKSTGLGLLELESGEVWHWELGGDADSRGAVLANPFRSGLRPMDVKAFVSLLRSVG